MSDHRNLYVPARPDARGGTSVSSGTRYTLEYHIEPLRAHSARETDLSRRMVRGRIYIARPACIHVHVRVRSVHLRRAGAGERIHIGYDAFRNQRAVHADVLRHGARKDHLRRRVRTDRGHRSGDGSHDRTRRRKGILSGAGSAGTPFSGDSTRSAIRE